MTSLDVFDRIRSACAGVANAATHVTIVAERIPSFATELDLTNRRSDPAQQRTGDDESTAAFVMALDAVNFGSGYFPRLQKRPGHSGYHTVAASVRDLVDQTGPLTTTRLREWTIEDSASTFGQQLVDDAILELMSRFTTAWHQLAAFVDRVGDGRFLGVIEEAGGSAAHMVGLLDAMPYFHDVHRHPAVGAVPLYKRAQITVQDLAIAFAHQGPGRFADIDRLTMFADNLVPHVLRVEGVLHFEPDLVRRIDAVEDIAAGSVEEVEIRACGVHAVELLRAELVAQGNLINSADLDNVLWGLGGEAKYKAVARHRSCSVFY